MTQRSVYRWKDYEQECRAVWERTFPNVAWSEVNDGYRYGWEQAHDPRFWGRDWRSVEEELRKGWGEWERRHCMSSMAYKFQHTWETLKQNIRAGWEQGRSESES